VDRVESRRKADSKPGYTKQPSRKPHENAATSRYFPESSLVKGALGDVQDKGSVKAFIAYLQKEDSIRLELRTVSARWRHS
jgi:hypothetical protein